MELSSSVFVMLFLPFLLLVYALPVFKRPVLKKVLLIIASLAFYTWGEPIYLLLLLASIIVNYFFGRGIASNIENSKAKKL